MEKTADCREYMACISGQLADFRTYIRTERFPEFGASPPKLLDDIWQKGDYFPGSEAGVGAAGVYLVLNPDLKVIYIGKASGTSSTGARLGTLFVTDPTDRQKWRLGPDGRKLAGLRPYALSVITLPYESAWLAPALEEYLIRQLRPAGNDKCNPKRSSDAAG